MSLATRMLRYDKAVYWAPQLDEQGNVLNDNYGNVLLSDPTEIQVRWQDEQDEIVNNQGRVVITCAKVFTDRDVIVGGIMWHGLLANINESQLPFDNLNAVEIKKFNNIPGLRYQPSKTVRIAMLGVKGPADGN